MKGESHEITIAHMGSTHSPPDFDYTAAIASVDPSAGGWSIDDPDGILGVHNESAFNFAAGKSATLHFDPDLGIDSNNDGGVDDDDDDDEDDAPGHVFLLNDDDDDLNGTPDLDDQPGAVDDDLTKIFITPGLEPDDPAASWWKLVFPPRIRIYRNADRTEPIETGTENDWPPPGMLYVEGVAESQAAGDVTITLTIQIDDLAPFTDSVRATVAKLSIHDLRHWGPTWNIFAGPGIENMNLDADLPDSEVGGAITDGASICLIRVTPDLGDAQFMIEVAKPGEPRVNRPDAMGGVVFANNTTTLPPLPMPADPVAAGFTTSSDMDKAFYVPPPNYLDPLHNPGDPDALNSQETAQIEFRLEITSPNIGFGPIPGGRSFLLRRPPLVLVHGLFSSPDTWDTAAWNETPGASVPTRIYKVDYSDTNDKGYDDNWFKVAFAIEEALQDYRTANDGDPAVHTRGFNGVRYAATRADVVGHSMGGILTRLYVSDLIVPQQLPREKKNILGNWVANNRWWKIAVSRDENFNDGRWPYLRSANWGAGSIRRFVTLGSPFDGSPLAAPAVKAETIKHKAEKITGRFIEEIVGNPFAGAPGGINEVDIDFIPHALIDLMEDGTFQRLLESAAYPTGSKRVHWRPVAGQATANIPPPAWQEVLWAGALLLPNGLVGADLPSPTDSDLVVRIPSQFNGQPAAGDLFPSTVHMAFPGMDQFGVFNETASPLISLRLRELLSQPPSAMGQGDLQP